MKIIKIKNLLLAYYFLLSILGIACNGLEENVEEIIDTENSRFKSDFYGENSFEVLIDTEKDLVWVNDARGCFAAIVNPTTECAELTFADRDDWRTPTSQEMSELIIAIDAENMNLNYINSNCSLMSTSDTIWVFTENSSIPGEFTTNKPGNAGLRCVTNN